ncbi:MAG: hypothetical protein HQL03_04470 [Nitrospirae bacterium]|nr:hypothetical protein [Nitrospirota bacterium]MBF0590756.1 hypothetical protein [Nitrospirota bacterium]
MLTSLLMAVHVIGVVMWIGGVVFVTLIIFPMIMRMEQSFEKVMFFQGTEHRFAKIAKVCVFLVGLTGGLLLWRTGEHRILFTLQGIGPTIMLLVWTFYVLVLLFEAKVFKAVFSGKAQQDTELIFRRLTQFHYVVMGLSLLAIAVGVGAAHYSP